MRQHLCGISQGAHLTQSARQPKAFAVGDSNFRWNDGEGNDWGIIVRC